MVNCVILVAVLFHSLFVVTRVTAYLEVYEKSCRNSYLARLGDNYFCDIVEWRTAVLYGKNSYSLYETGTSLSAVQQDNVAKTLYDNIRNGNNLSKSCRDALKAFVCVETFPHCPNQGSPKSTVSYFPTCVAQCRQAQSLCGSLSIDCSSYNHANCGFYAKSGYYLPHPTQVFYNL